MSWNNIIGQSRVKTILINSLKNNRVAHAYLFSGPVGVGKDAVAFEIAKILNCELNSFEACDTCSSCKKFETLQHPNLSMIFSLPIGKNEEKGDHPLAKLDEEVVETIKQQIKLKAKNHYYRIIIPKANAIKINSIREIRKVAALSPFGKGKKVFVILNAENLNEESSNALLKTLEEPLEDTVLILTTSQPEVLLPTIISRCQHIKFDSLKVKEISDALLKYENLDSEQAKWIAQLANGSYLRALELINPDFKEFREAVINFLRIVLYKSRLELIKQYSDVVSNYQKVEIEEFLKLLMNWLRMAMLFEEGISVVLTEEDSDVIRKFVEAHPRINYLMIFERLYHAISLLNKNVYIPLIFQYLANEIRKIILTRK